MQQRFERVGRSHFISLLLVGGFGAIGFPASAQVIPDATLGTEASVVTPDVIRGGVGDRITGGAARGQNLFHSFSQFDIPAGRGAYFDNPAGLENIFSRVTGSSISQIFGTLGTIQAGSATALGTANLYFMNPNGILFGPAARLDVGGSFAATTASAIGFGDRGSFSADNPEAPSVLTINPSALFFNRIQNGAIVNQSTGDGLFTTNGRNLTLVGGNVILDGGRLFALGGRVEVGGLAGVGTIQLNAETNSSSLSFPNGVPRADVTLQNNNGSAAIAATSGGTVRLFANNVDLSGVSFISTALLPGESVRAGDVFVDALGSTSLSGGSSILATSGGAVHLLARDVALSDSSSIQTSLQSGERIRAGDIRIDASRRTSISGSSLIGSIGSSESRGDTGNISINANSIQMQNSQISTTGERNRGNISLRAIEDVVLDGSDVSSSGTLGGIGDSGNITINARAIRLANQASIGSPTFGSGRGGRTTIQAQDEISLSGGSGIISSTSVGQLNVTSRAPGGDIIIQGRSLSLSDSGTQIAANTVGSGRAGNIQINTRESVTLRDSAFITTKTEGDAADGGDIRIQTGRLSATSTSSIRTTTTGELESGVVGRGNSGNLFITAEQLSLTAGGRILSDSTQSRGNAGNITIQVGTIELDGFSTSPALSGLQSQISSRVVQTDRSILDANIQGGTISIDTRRLRLNNGGSVTVDVVNGRGRAGAIVVNASESIHITGRARPNQPSGLSTSVQTNGIGDGGTIRVSTRQLDIEAGGSIEAATLSRGNAGSIFIFANRIAIRGFRSSITTQVASGGRGNAGSLQIQAQQLKVLDNAGIISGTFGIGNAGNLLVRANQIELIGTPDSGSNTTGLFTGVGLNAQGNAGNLSILSNHISMRNRAGITSATNGRGRAGNIQIIVNQRIYADNSSISSGVIENGIGNGGDIRISTGTLSLNNGAQVFADTRGRGRAGNIIINARDRIFFDGRSAAVSSVAQGAIGRGGDIRISTNSFFLTNGSQLLASTRGRGNAGNVTVIARDRVSFDGIIGAGRLASLAFSSVEQGAIGQGGDIRISTNSLFLTNGSQLFASTRGRGNAGNVIIDARDRVSFDGTNRVNGNPSAAFSTVERGAVGRGGDIRISTNSLSLTNGAQLLASTLGQGDAGNVIINARDRISLNGIGFRDGRSSGIFANNQLSQSGQSGGIFLTTSDLSIANGAVISATTANARMGGSINLNADQFTALNGGQVIVTARRNGQAGSITLNASQINLSGRDTSFTSRLQRFGRAATSNEGTGESGLFADTRSNTSGAGGNLTVNADRLSLTDGAVISAQSRGTGQAGNLQLNITDRLQLTDSNIVTSATRSSGGNISINTSNNSGITLLNNGNITTQSQGDGGNITIGGAGIVAFGDSSILARSLDQRGGNITLSPFFGDRTSNITVNADGRTSSGNILQPDTSFVQNALNQPEQDTIDTNTLVASSCIARENRADNRFAITGTGGLPESPGGAGPVAFATGEVRSLTETAETAAAERPWQTGDPIVEPQGVYQLPDGSLVLSRECG